MVKYEFKNYISHKKAVVIEPQKDDYYFGEKWFVEFYKLGELEEHDWDRRGTQGTGCKSFDNEAQAIRSAMYYVKH